MAALFAVGDRVRVIDAAKPASTPRKFPFSLGQELVVGKVKDGGRYLALRGDGGWWAAARFEPLN